jgi:hypothetical protein
MGYVIHERLGDARGDCDPVSANRPDNFAPDADWPAGFDVSQYTMSPYEAVKFPSRDAGIEVGGWWMPVDPAAPAVILVHGIGGCKNAIDMLVPAGMLWRNGFNVLRIDVKQSEQLAAAARSAGANVTTWFPENGEHVQTPAVYPEEFEKRLVGFFRDALTQ